MSTGTKRIECRVSDAEWKRLEGFRKASGVATTSQALRMALFAGIERSLELDEAWRRASHAEGMRDGQKKFMEATARFAQDLSTQAKT